MYESLYPLDAPAKVRALLIDDEDRLVVLRREKPDKPIYHVTAGGKIEPKESKRHALVRELREELDARVTIGRPMFAWLNTTYYAARLVKLGPKPFTGPEFSDKKLGQYAIAHLRIEDVVSGAVDLQPQEIVDFLARYEGALLNEVRRLRKPHV